MLGDPDDSGLPAVNVLEFNVRFGDPETSVLLARLADDLVPYLLASARGDFGALAKMRPPVTADAAIAVVIAAEGYPGKPRTGDPIYGIEAANALENVWVLHAGTTAVDGQVVSNGGRVLCVTARGPDVESAAQRAYGAISVIDLRGSQHRKDIGYRARKVRF
jgi:phosphoribosylamine--glycine ligase